MRVLVVDDEPSIRLALKRFFQREGWEVELADDGRAAIDRLLTSPTPAAPTLAAPTLAAPTLAAPTPVVDDFDLIICDLRMPGCSGVELHGRLMQARPALLRRFVVVTGDAVSADAAEFIRRTACPVLHKPFELSALRALMHGGEHPPR